MAKKSIEQAIKDVVEDAVETAVETANEAIAIAPLDFGSFTYKKISCFDGVEVFGLGLGSGGVIILTKTAEGQSTVFVPKGRIVTRGDELAIEVV